MKSLSLRSAAVSFVSLLALAPACAPVSETHDDGLGAGGGAQSGGAFGTGGDVGAVGGSASGGTGVGGAGVGGELGTGGGATGGATGSGGTTASVGSCRSFANGSGTTQPCYVATDGKAYCIADDGTTTQLGTPGTAVNVTGKNFSTEACVVNDAGAVYCGQYAVIGSSTAVVTSGATQVSGSLTSACILAGTTIDCPGGDVTAPVLPEGTPTELACYYHGCCALNDAGKMYCWGDTAAIGGTGTAVREVPLPAGKTAIGMGPGQDHICALLEGGQVQCWGKDWNKQLGGLGENTTTGVTLVASGAVAVAAGQFHTCVAFEDGHVECVSGGQSEGAGLDQSALTAVANVSDAIALSAGKHYTCALNGNGTIQCWGRIGGGATPIVVTGPAAGPCN